METFDNVLQDNRAICASVFWDYDEDEEYFVSGHAMPLVGVKTDKYIFKDSAGVEGIEEGINKNQIPVNEVINSNQLPSQIDPTFVDTDDETEFSESATKFIHDFGFAVKFSKC